MKTILSILAVTVLGLYDFCWLLLIWFLCCLAVLVFLIVYWWGLLGSVCTLGFLEDFFCCFSTLVVVLFDLLTISIFNFLKKIT